MTKDINTQAAGEKGSITPRTIKGNNPIEVQDQSFQDTIRGFLPKEIGQDLPEHSLIVSQYQNNNQDQVIRFGISKAILKTIKENITKKTKTKVKDSIKRELEHIEDLLLIEALKFLQDSQNSDVVVIDMIERRNNDISVSELDSHTVTLWKYQEQVKSDEENSVEIEKIIVIDPSKGSYSKALHGKISHLLSGEFKEENYQVESLLPDDNIVFYATRGLHPNISEYGQENPPPRNCIDVAIKIAFALQQLLNNQLIDHSKDTIKYKLLELSNQFYPYENTKLLAGSALREIQSSNPKTREKAKNILQEVLNDKKLLPLLTDAGLVNKSIDSITDSLQKTHNLLDEQNTRKDFVINGKTVNSNIQISSGLFIQRRDIDGKLISEDIDELLYQEGKDYVVIESEAGSGKTRFVAEYAKEKQLQGQMVKWFNASSSDSMVAEYRIMAEQLGIDTKNINIHDIVSILRGVLAEQNIIFVFDNVEDYRHINLYMKSLPQSVKVVITQRPEVQGTKNAENVGGKQGAKINLGEFSEIEAKDYLKKTLPTESQDQPKSKEKLERTKEEQIDSIIKTIGTLPLKLNLAISYIKDNPRFTVDQVIDSLQKDEGSIFTKVFNSITKTEISWKLLQYAAHLDAGFVSIEIFEHLWNVCKLNSVIDDNDISLQISLHRQDLLKGTNFAFKEQDLLLVLKYLATTGLIEYVEKDGSKGIKIHRLVQEEVNEYASSYKQEQDIVEEQEIANNLLRIIAELMPYVEEISDSTATKATMLINTSKKVLDLVENNSESLKEQSLLLESMGKYYYTVVADNKLAIDYFKKSLITSKSLYSGNHPAIVTSLNNIGIAYQCLGDFANGLKYQLEALEMMREIYPANHPAVATALNNVGNAYQHLGDLANCLKYQLEALEMKREIYPANHPAVAASLNNVGVAYDASGDLAKGLKYQLEALKMMREIYPANHPDFATALSNIGSAYQVSGDLANALKYKLEALKMKREIYPANHPNVAASLNNIGSAYEASRDLAKGLKCQLEALEMRREIYPGNHPDVAQSLNNVGSAYQNLGDLANGLKYQLETLETMREIYPDNHPAVATALNNVGSAYEASGDLAKGLKYQLEALKMMREIYPDNHPDFATALSNVGSAYQKLEKPCQAIEYMFKANEIMSNFKTHQYKEEIKQRLMRSVVDLAEQYSIDLRCAGILLQVSLDDKLEFLDYKVQIGISDSFYNKNALELALAANQLALIFAENNENATDIEKQSIVHNAGCLYNTIAQKASSENDQEKSQKYVDKAEASFQKALSYASNSDNSADLYTEYANFLVRQGDFKHAFEYLQKAIKSNKSSDLLYGETEKDVIADILTQAITASGQEEIQLDAKEYAYYLLIANYNNFVSSGIGKIEDQHKYLEQFMQHSMNTEKISYTSCLLLAKACYLCDRVTDATIFALVPLVYQMYKLEQHKDLNDTKIDIASDDILMGHINEPEEL